MAKKKKKKNKKQQEPSVEELRQQRNDMIQDELEHNKLEIVIVDRKIKKYSIILILLVLLVLSISLYIVSKR